MAEVHGPAAHTQAGDISGAILQLEAVFLKAECDLNYVSRKLDTEFETIFADNGQENVGASSHKSYGHRSTPGESSSELRKQRKRLSVSSRPALICSATSR
jgi:hypothetical protein